MTGVMHTVAVSRTGESSFNWSAEGIEIRDDVGAPWRVFDARMGPEYVYGFPGSDPAADYRCFVAADGRRRWFLFSSRSSRDVTERTLLQQLKVARVG